MQIKTLKVCILYRILIALTLALCLIPVAEVPVAALSIDDYFLISYTVEFSKDEIHDNKTFYVTVTGQATCINDLPLTVSEAYVTGYVVARHEESDTEIILNSSYTISISPFPNEEGDVVQASQIVPLKFPEDSIPGTYNVAGGQGQADNHQSHQNDYSFGYI